MTTDSQQAETTDRIEKRFDVNASRSRVWRAISNAEEFGAWFGVKINAPFTAGTTVQGQLTLKGYEHMSMDLQIERIEPEHYFSYRWHPYAVDPKFDYSAEPMTLVEFRLEETDGRTSVLITESGFDKLPISRRAEALRMNEGGWTGQAKKLASYVS